MDADHVRYASVRVVHAREPVVITWLGRVPRPDFAFVLRQQEPAKTDFGALHPPSSLRLPEVFGCPMDDSIGDLIAPWMLLGWDTAKSCPESRLQPQGVNIRELHDVRDFCALPLG